METGDRKEIKMDDLIVAITKAFVISLAYIAILGLIAGIMS